MNAHSVMNAAVGSSHDYELAACSASYLLDAVSKLRAAWSVGAPMDDAWAEVDAIAAMLEKDLNSAPML